ncbi:armadillo-type protein [Mycena sanguinolenta]|nr:armadillo-type protein [Mycena sanguinolenta]
MAKPHEFECHSVHSWWSDSNSLGATIPLHTFAKPLAKFLHNRQVTALLAKSRDSPLSAELLDLLTIYLESKEISVATKIHILHDLEIRAATQDDANIIVKKNGLPTLIFLLSSSDSKILELVCNVFGTLVLWTYPDAEALSSYAFERMIYLSMHENPSIRGYSLNALNRLVALSEAAAQTAASAGIIDITARLLLSRNRDILEQTYGILNNLARHDTLKVALAESAPYHLLIADIEYEQSQIWHSEEVASHATYALSQICRVDVGIYSFSNVLLELLGSADDAVVASSCRLLGNLARSEVLNTAIAKSTCCQYLVSLIGTRTSILQNELSFTISEICSYPPGARAVADAIIIRKNGNSMKCKR